METRQPLRLLTILFVSAGLGLTFCSSSTESEGEKSTTVMDRTTPNPTTVPSPETTLRPVVPIAIGTDGGTAPGHDFSPIFEPPMPTEHPCPGCPPPDPPPPERDLNKPHPPLPAP